MLLQVHHVDLMAWLKVRFQWHAADGVLLTWDSWISFEWICHVEDFSLMICHHTGNCLYMCWSCLCCSDHSNMVQFQIKADLNVPKRWCVDISINNLLIMPYKDYSSYWSDMHYQGWCNHRSKCLLMKSSATFCTVWDILQIPETEQEAVICFWKLLQIWEDIANDDHARHFWFHIRSFVCCNNAVKG